MKPPLLNFEIFWTDLDQKTPEKRPKTRSKFVKSTKSCHSEFSSSFWCVVFFSSGPCFFNFFFETKTQTNLITPGKPGFQTVFLIFKWVLLERIFILNSRFVISQIFFGLYGLLILTFPFFLRCTTQLQLTAAHSTTAYRPQSFDEITQSVWSERYKYSKVFGFNCQIILKYLMKKTKKRLFWLKMYNWYLCLFCLDKTKWEGESWASWESRQSFNRFLQKNVPIS